MKRAGILVAVFLLVFPVMVFAGAKKFGPLTFLDNQKAANITVDGIFGGPGGVGFGMTIEAPPSGSFYIFKLIPGVGMKLTLGLNDGFFIQNALCLRAKLNDRLIFLGGAGLGLHIEEGTYVPIVVGADYFIGKKLLVAGTFSVGGPGLVAFNVGIGLGGGY